jgi:hemerythrin superfamily protein
MSGRIQEFLSADHRRLDALLEQASARADRVDAAAFWEFRTGLLEHIGMEERILFPAVRKARSGEPFAWARRLREDHGLIASMLVPTPTRERVVRLAAILAAHDLIEEGPSGAYADGEAALGEAGVDAVLARLRVAPTPPPSPYFDGPRRP